MPIIALIAVGVAITAGAAGAAASAGDKKSALDLQKDALLKLQNINTPDAEAMKIQLEKYISAGEVAPEMQQAIEAAPSLMKDIQVDPRLKQAQMGALQSLQQLSVSGLRPEDEAALSKIRNQVAQEENARQQSILQGMQQRGIGGAGEETAARLISSQGAANRASQQGLDIGAQASQRALQAIMQSGQLGGQIGSQEFSQEAQKSQAQDVINKYNSMNAQQVHTANIQAKNQAQSQNLANKQAISNANVGQSNQEQQYNVSLAQKDYENKLKLAQVQAGAMQDMSKVYQQQAAQTQQVASDIGKSASSGIGSMGGMGGKK